LADVKTPANFAASVPFVAVAINVGCFALKIPFEAVRHYRVTGLAHAIAHPPINADMLLGGALINSSSAASWCASRLTGQAAWLR
jgi:hypothetical protein